MYWTVCLVGAAAVAFVLTALGAVVSFASGIRHSSVLPQYIVLCLICFIGGTLLSPVIHFGVFPILVSAFVIVLVLRVVRSRRVKKIDPSSSDLKMPHAPRQFAPLVIGLTFNFVFLLLVFSRSGLTPNHLVQQYDNPFHFSVVRHILDTGNASPLGAGSVMGNSTAIYPDVWHSLVALLVMLFGLDMQTAGWIVSLAFVGFVAPIGMHDLYTNLQTNPSKSGEVLSVVLPVILPLSVMEFSYGGSLYSNLIGLCMVPSALSVLLRAFDPEFQLTLVGRVFWPLIAFAVVGFSHPNTVFVLGIFSIPFLIKRLRSRISKLIALTISTSIWIGCCFLPIFSRTVNCPDCIVRGVEKGSAFISRLHLDYSFFASNEWVLWVFFAAFIFIIVMVLLKLPAVSTLGPYLVGVCLSLGLMSVALFPQTLLAKFVVGFWYRDIKRLIVTTLFMGSILIPIAIDDVSKSLAESEKIISVLRRPLEIAFLLVAILFIATVGFRYYSSCLLPKGDRIEPNSYAQLTNEDRTFFSKVSDTVGSSVVLNNYNDSSVWLYSFYHVNALIKGRPANQITSMSDDLYTAVRGVALAGSSSAEGSKVRSALHKLHVRYYLQFEETQNTTTRFMSNGQIDYQPAGESGVVTDDTPGFEKVLSDGRYTLYELL